MILHFTVRLKGLFLLLRLIGISPFFVEISMNRDGYVKVWCDIIECKNNLFTQNKGKFCNLKHITINVGSLEDYPHGVNGMCQQMEIVSE